jgi:drug/metabolite transporter (DMT)-like permease
MKWILVITVVLSTSAADLLKSMAMREHGEVHDFRPGAFAKLIVVIIKSPLLLAAISGSILSFLGFVALLSVAELSFAVPATSSVFVLEAVCARILLHEDVTWKRWVGVSFIAFGIVFLSR